MRKRKYLDFCAKRPATVFPDWLVGDYIDYLKWVRRWCRAASHAAWKAEGGTTVYTACTFFRTNRRAVEHKALNLFVLPDQPNENELRVKIGSPSSELITLRFSLAKIGWTTLYEPGVFMNVSEDEKEQEWTMEIARLQVGAFAESARVRRAKAAFPPGVLQIILGFATEHCLPRDCFLDSGSEGSIEKQAAQRLQLKYAASKKKINEFQT